MYNLQYDHDGRLMLVKIEEVCVFSPKALDEVIARLRTLRDKAWHDWHAERHDPRALEMVIRHGGARFAISEDSRGISPHHPAQPARRPQRRRRSRLTVVAGGKKAS